MDASTRSAAQLDNDLQMAIDHHQKGQLQDAEKLYRAIVDHQPDNAIAVHNLGLLAGQQGRHADALSYLRNALALAPDEGEFWLSYARALLQSGDAPAAVETLHNIIGRGLDTPAVQALLSRAQAEVQAGPAGAAPTQQQTDHVVALYHAGQYAAMETAVRALLAQWPDSAFCWSVLATALRVQGKDAQQALRRTIELNPRDAEAHSSLGDALQEQGQLEEALPHYLRAVELDPNFASAYCNLGAALQSLGRATDAQASLRRALALDPDYANAHFNLANSLREQQHYEQAIGHYQAALESNPDDPYVLTYLADTLRHVQQIDAALPYYRRVIALLPDEAEAHANLGTALQQVGQLEQAVASQRHALLLDAGMNGLHANLAYALTALRRLDEAAVEFDAALALQPDEHALHAGLAEALAGMQRHADAEAALLRAIAVAPDHAADYFNLGNVQQGQARYQDALDSYRHALVLQPDHFEARFNLAVAQGHLKLYAEALGSYHQALELNPQSAVTHTNIGITLQSLGRLDEAMDSQLRALAIDPELAIAHCTLGSNLHTLGRFEEALAHGLRAVAIRPDFSTARRNVGLALQMLKREEEAVAHYVEILRTEPDNTGLYFDLGNSYRALGRSMDARASYEKALAIDPDLGEVHTNLALVLQEQGDVAGALANYRRALELAPDSAVIYSNLLFVMSHTITDAAELYAEHRRYGELIEAPLRDQWRRHDNDPDPDRPLRIGFVSGDLHQHAVTNFVAPVFELLVRMPSLSLYVYYNNTRIDSYTTILQQFLPNWRSIIELDDEAAEQLIRDDAIDILIDLSGHSALNRLPLFARRPAPIQASWLGYPGTTGLEAVDFYLSDALRLPPGRYDDQFTEAIVRMPLSAPFLHELDAPPVNELPALRNGYLTFGSFNRANKLSREVIGLWAQLLHALPDAKMLLAGLGQGEAYQALLGWFAEEDIDPARLVLSPRTTMKQYMEMHHQVDICVNPFPYTGATTLCHALWMGVPTLTTTGPTIPSHGGASYLTHLGLDAFVAEDFDTFVKRGVFLSNNLPALASLRASLRQRFNDSIVGQPAVTAAGMARAFRIMWQRWCAGIPPGAIRVDLDDIMPREMQARGEAAQQSHRILPDLESPP